MRTQFFQRLLDCKATLNGFLSITLMTMLISMTLESKALLKTMLGLGLGIDYSLLIVSRFREELRSHKVEQAIVQTLGTGGRAVCFSGLTVCIGLGCLTLFPILLLQSLGIAGAIVVLLSSVAAALTLLPALLGFVGHRIYGSHSQPRSIAKRQGFWSAIANTVTRYSLVALVVVLVIVAELTSPFLAARFGIGNEDILPGHWSIVWCPRIHFSAGTFTNLAQFHACWLFRCFVASRLILFVIWVEHGL